MLFRSDEISNRLKKIIENGYDFFTSKHYRKNGSVFDIEISVTYLYSENGFFVCFVRDITHRKRSEEILRNSEEKYHLIDEASQDFIYSYNREGRFTHANSKLCNALGLKYEEIIGKTHHELGFPLEQCLEWEKLHNQVYETDATVIAETVTPIQDSEPQYFEVVLSPMHNLDGKIIGIAGTTRDINERIKAAKALKESEKRFDLAMSVKNEGIWDWNLITNEAYFDDRYYTMAGYLPREFPQTFTEWAEHVHPDDLPIAQSAIQMYLSGQSDIFDTEFRFRHKDGSWIWIQGRGKIVERDGKGIPLRMLGTHTDITQRKSIEYELMQSNLFVEQTLEQSPVPMVVVSMPDMVIRIVNHAALEFLGITDEPNMAGLPLSEVPITFRDFDANGIEGSLMELPLVRSLNGIRTNNEERRIVRKDGTDRWELVTATPIFGTNGEIIAGYLIMIDITERKKSEEKIVRMSSLQQSLNKFMIEQTEINEYEKLIKKIVTQIDILLNPIVTVFSAYDKETKVIRVKQIKANRGILDLVIKISGKKIFSTPTFVSDEMFLEMTSERIRIFSTLNEVTNGAISNTVSNAIGKVLKIKCYLVFSYIIDDQVFGTSLIALEKEPDRFVIDLMKNFAHFSSISIKRVLTEEELRKSEENFRFLVDNSSDLIWKINSDGVFLYVSPSWKSILGYDSSFMTEKPFQSFVHTEDVKSCENYMIQVLDAKKTLSGPQYRVKHIDGSWRWHEASITPVFNDKGTLIYFVGVSRDITDRKRAEERIRQSRQMLQTIIDTVPQSIFWKDINSIYLGCNKVFAQAVGLNRPEEIIGKNDYDLPWPKEEADAYRADDQYVIMSNKVMLHIIEPLQQADGTRLLIDTSKMPLSDEVGKPIGVLGIYEDITERKRAEEELQKSERKARAILDQSFQFMGLLSLDGILIDANRSALEFIGVTPSEVLNKPFWECPWWTHSSEIQDKLKESIKKTAQGEIIRYETTNYSSDGSLHNIDFSLRPVKDEEGNVLFLIPEGHNITERKMAEDALVKTNQMLELVMNTIPEFIFWKDRNSIYQGCNKNFAKAAGVESPKDIVGKTDYDLAWKKEEADFFRECDEQVMSSGIAEYHIIEPQQQSDGKQAWLDTNKIPLFDETGKVIGILGTYQDISERKQAEEDLKESEERFRTFAELAPVGIVISDKDGIVKYLSKKFIEIFGYTIEDIPTLNEWWLKAYPDERLRERVQNEWKSSIIQSLETNSEIKPVVFPVTRKDGSIIQIEFRLSSTKDMNFTIFVDITERKRSEDILNEERKRLNFIMEVTQTHINISDKEYNLHYVDSAWQRIYGDPQGKKCYEYFMDRNTRCENSGIPKAFETNQIVVYEEFLPKENRTIEVHTIPFKNEKGEWLAAEFNVDVTERKREEEELLKASERARLQRNALVQLTNDESIVKSDVFESLKKITKIISDVLKVERTSVWMLSQDETELNCLILYNAKENSYSEKKTLKTSDFPLYFKVLMEESIINANNALTDSRTSEFVENYLIPFDIHSMLNVAIQLEGRLIGIVCLEHTYTKRTWHYEETFFISALSNLIAQLFANAERKRAEFLIRESEIKYRTLIEQMQEGLLVADLNGIIQYVNKSFCEIVGYDYDELVGKSGYDLLLSDEDINEIKIKDENRRNNLAEKYELNVFTKTRELKTLWFHSTPVKDQSGIITGSMSTVIDITDIKKAEQELLQKNEQLERQYEEYMQLNEVLRQTNYDLEVSKEKAEESDRLKTAFLQNMSHEIRTPLNGIIGFSKLLIMDDITKEEIIEYTNVIMKSGDRLLETINNVLEISKIETGQIGVQYSLFSINTVINDLFQFYLPNAEIKNIKLHYNNYFDDDNSTIISDKIRIHQILSNLLNNALKFTNEGIIEFGYELEDNNLLFYVKDTGIGISKENQERIFERFIQVDLSLKRDYEGTGLGLSICKGLVELLNGNIWVESELNKGTAFYFKIPYIPTVEKKLEQNKNLQVTHNKKKTKILIVEDDATSYKFMFRLLKNRDLDIIRAETGEQAIEIAINDLEIDLILMDIRIPNINGLEATKEIKKVRPNLPIIAQTAYAFKEEVDKILESGCDDYISKPLDVDKLFALIDKYRINYENNPNL